MNLLNLPMLSELAKDNPGFARTLEISFWTGVVNGLTSLMLYLTDGQMVDWRLIVASFIPALLAGAAKRLRDING